MRSEKLKILFLCSGNSCRSQMAEGFLKKYGEERFEVISAGTNPESVNPLAIKVMAEKGIDISQHQTNEIGDFLGRVKLDYVIIVCQKASKSCPHIWPDLINPPLFWDFEDPAAIQGDEKIVLNKFREVRDGIERKIKMFVEIFSFPVN